MGATSKCLVAVALAAGAAAHVVVHKLEEKNACFAWGKKSGCAIISRLFMGKKLLEKWNPDTDFTAVGPGHAQPESAG